MSETPQPEFGDGELPTVNVPLIRVEQLKVVEVRDLGEGALIMAPVHTWSFVLGQVIQVEPRYGEGSAKPYGRVTVVAMMGEREEMTFFAPYGTMFLMVVEDDSGQPF